MIVMVVLGAVLGGCVFCLLWILVPRRASVLVQLARFDARPGTDPDPQDFPPGQVARIQGRVGAVLAVWLARRGIHYPTLRQDLVLTGRTFEEVLAAKVLAFAGGFFLIAAAAAVLRADAGLSLPLASPALLAAGAGAALFFVPDVQAHRQAAIRRRQFRRALGSWLDLVALQMAGSAAPDQALPMAARVSTSWPMLVLSDTLYRATTAGQDHWEALTELGYRIGVRELIDLATLARMVGRDGARVRDTLTARAVSMRRALLAEAESQAGRRDQWMLLFQVQLGVGFICFLTFPAIANVLAF